MKKNRFVLVLGVLFVFGFVLVGCDNGTTGGLDPAVETEVKDSISAKWEISSGPYASVEFNKDGTYIVVEKSGTNASLRADAWIETTDAYIVVERSGANASARASASTGGVYTGTYRVISATKITLVDFGDLDNISVETDDFRFTIKPDGSNAVECTAKKADAQIDSSPETDLLCHSWNVVSMYDLTTKNTIELSRYKAEGTMTFSPYGTYMIYVKTPTTPQLDKFEEEVELAEWNWANPGKELSYKNALGNPGKATIEELTASTLKLTDPSYTYVLTR